MLHTVIAMMINLLFYLSEPKFDHPFKPSSQSSTSLMLSPNYNLTFLDGSEYVVVLARCMKDTFQLKTIINTFYISFVLY